MRDQNRMLRDDADGIQKPSTLSIIAIIILIILSCLVLLSSCATWSKAPYYNKDYGNGRYYDNARRLVVREIPS